MGDHDYETIEAAVTETVRGRWFLNEFARRNRMGEMRQLLDAMARLESAVAPAQPALPPPAPPQAALPPPAPPSADPSIRLLIQRIKEVAGALDAIAGDMRVAGLDERFAGAVEGQARAVAGMMRGGPPKPAVSTPAAQSLRADLPASSPTPAPQPATGNASAVDRRLAVLSDLDRLSLAEKLALFT